MARPLQDFHVRARPCQIWSRFSCSPSFPFERCSGGDDSFRMVILESRDTRLVKVTTHEKKYCRTSSDKLMNMSAATLLGALDPAAVESASSPSEIAVLVTLACLRAHGGTSLPSSLSTLASRSMNFGSSEAIFAPVVMGDTIILHLRVNGGPIHKLSISSSRFVVGSEREIHPGGVVQRLGAWNVALFELTARIETHLIFRALPFLRPACHVASPLELPPPILHQQVLSCLDWNGLASVAGTAASGRDAARVVVMARPLHLRRRPLPRDTAGQHHGGWWWTPQEPLGLGRRTLVPVWHDPIQPLVPDGMRQLFGPEMDPRRWRTPAELFQGRIFTEGRGAVTGGLGFGPGGTGDFR